MIDRHAKTLVQICERIGQRVLVWTQGSGGNVSFKEGKSLVIKASGKRLFPIGLNQIVTCDLESLQRNLLQGEISETTYVECLRVSKNPGQSESIRPSMETGFHAILPQQWVLHFHALTSLWMAYHFFKQRERFQNWLSQKSSLKIAILPWLLPGKELIQPIQKERAADIIILRNHGVVLQGEKPAEILRHWEKFEEIFCKDWGYEEFLSQEKDFFQKIYEEAQSHAMPFKIFFPDAELLKDRTLKIIQGREEGWVLNPRALEEDEDATEIWLASFLLHKYCLGLDEYPESLRSQLASLPTEQWRLQ